MARSTSWGCVLSPHSSRCVPSTGATKRCPQPEQMQSASRGDIVPLAALGAGDVQADEPQVARLHPARPLKGLVHVEVVAALAGGDLGRDAVSVGQAGKQ